MKTLLYLFIFLVLAGGAWYFLMYDREPDFAHTGNFSVKDTASVSKIFMANTAGQSVTLSRDAEGWLVNGTYRAAARPMQTLLKTLYLQQVQFVVPNKIREMVLRGLAGSAIKVEVYGAGDKKIRTFFVGQEANNYNGTYMLQEGSEQPYGVGIQGFNGFLTPRYITDPELWRDRAVIALNPAEIQSVSVAYPDEGATSNFTITRTGPDSTSWKVEGIPALNLDPQKLNKARLLPYMWVFSRLYAEAFINGMTGVEEGMSDPYAVITIKPKEGPQQVVRTYRMALNRRSKNLGTGSPMEQMGYDEDRLYAIFNGDRDTAVIQYRDFNKVFRRSYEFFEQDQADATGPGHTHQDH